MTGTPIRLRRASLMARSASLAATLALAFLAPRAARAADSYKLEATLVWPSFGGYNCTNPTGVVYEWDNQTNTAWPSHHFGVNTDTGEFPDRAGVHAYNKSVGPTMGLRVADFPSTMLNVGSNQILYFDGPDWTQCWYLESTVRLYRPGREAFVLYSGSSGEAPHPGNPSAAQFNLSFNFQFDGGKPPSDWVDPVLAQQIKALFDKIDWYLSDSWKQGFVEAEHGLNDMNELAELEQDLDELLSHSLDDIDVAKLDAIATKYGDLANTIESLLRPILEAVKKKIEELRHDIAEATQKLNEQIAQLTDLVGVGTPADPNNTGAYGPLADMGAVSIIDLPAGFSVPFDDQHNPYKAYADSVLKEIANYVGSGLVIDHNGLALAFDAWRTNQQRLDKWIQDRGALASTKEEEAHVREKQRVLAEFNKYIGPRGWFADCAVPQLFRDLIDFEYVLWDKKRAQSLKLELNTWRGTLNEKQRDILDFLLLLDALHKSASSASDPSEAERYASRSEKLYDGLVGFARGAAYLVVGFTPLGDFLDACEFITGWDGCDWTVPPLSRTKRLIAGAGIFVIGSVRLITKAAEKMGQARRLINEADGIYHDLRPRIPKKGIIRTIPSPPNPHGINTTFFHESGLEIKFSSQGFPDFKKYLYKGTGGKNRVKIKLANDRYLDEKAANVAAGFSSTPKNHVWHHNEEIGIMELVEENAHEAFAHNGGFALYKRVVDGAYELVEDE